MLAKGFIYQTGPANADSGFFYLVKACEHELDKGLPFILTDADISVFFFFEKERRPKPLCSKAKKMNYLDREPAFLLLFRHSRYWFKSRRVIVILDTDITRVCILCSKPRIAHDYDMNLDNNRSESSVFQSSHLN